MIAGMSLTVQQHCTTGFSSVQPEDTAWDAFVASHRHAQFLQTSAWARLKARFGWETGRVAIGRDGALYGGASLLIRRAAGVGVAYVPRGPVVDWDDAAAVAATLAAVEVEARRRGAAVLRVEPELADSFAAQALLRRHGFLPSPYTVQPPSTIVLSLAGDEAAVLARMKSKWRYNVRLAERKGVTVRELARHELPLFQRLMDETGARDGFALHSPDYYAAAYDLLVPRWGAFLLAEAEGQPLAALVVVACGATAWYVWGASAGRERQRMPNHALQWAAMRWARARGAQRYDFWGIPDELGRVAVGLAGGSGAGTPVEALPLDLEELPEAGLWGVYRFKQGFGGDVVRHVGTWDKPLATLGYRLFTGGLAARVMAQQAATAARRLRASARTPALSAGERWQRVDDAATWRRVTLQLPDPHVLQSWEWGEVKRQTGWEAHRWVLMSGDGTPLAALQFLERQLIRGLPLRVAYVPKGPLLDWTRRASVAAVLDHIQHLAWQRRCIFVKIDPDVDDTTQPGMRLRLDLAARGWRFSCEQVQFKNTAFSDLRPDDEARLEVMKSKWRYNVRLAQRRGIRVRFGAAMDLPAFFALYAETATRDGFLIRPFAYYRQTWERFLVAQEEAENPAGGALLLAEHGEESAPVAGLFLLRYGARAWYFYGASSERRRRDMPNYLLQWEAMRWARAQGCTVYDWWGAPTQLHDPTDSLQGVWQFKQGFGAVFASHIGAWDYPVVPPLYRLYTEVMPRVLAFLRGRRAANPSPTPGQ